MAAAGGSPPKRRQADSERRLKAVESPEPGGASSSEGLSAGESNRAQVSFDQFYAAEYRPVFGLAYVLTGNQAVAEDTAQDAFTAAYRQWHQIGSYDSPAAWVRRVVCNRAASVVRRRAREVKAMLRLASHASSQIQLDDSDAEFWRAIRGLPHRQAQAVALYYLHDYSVRQIAEVLDCSEGTVKTHLSRARTAVARQLRLEEDNE